MSSGVTFHAFPHRDKILCKRWEIATKIDKFSALQNDVLCSVHFAPTSYRYTGSTKLKDDAVPTIFSFPSTSSHCNNVPVERKPPRKRPLSDTSNQGTVVENKLQKIAPSSPSKEDLRELLKSKDAKLEEQRRKIKVLQQKVRRRDAKIQNLQDLITDLKEKGLLRPNVSDLLSESFSGLSCELIKNHFSNQDKKNQGHRYDDEVKKFALTVHFYSPRAYEYLRPILSLPHPRALRHWTSSVECDAGFFEDVFTHLKNLVGQDPINADCCLIFDGMSIYQSVKFNKTKGAFEGFVDLGKDIVLVDEHDDTVAKEALIFMLSSLRAHWKYPVGYVLIDGLDADSLSSLVTRALQLSFEHNMKVKTLTCDGTKTNFSAMKLMGCKIGKTAECIDGRFVFGKEKNVIQWTPDIVHMLKLARNALSDMKVMRDGEGRLIEWRFIEELHDEQVREGIKFRNKLSSQHIHYHRQKMKVRLAAQTLSSSVADAIDFLRLTGLPQFQNSEGTVKFIRTVDRLFDLLNAKSPHGKGFKSPLRLGNRQVWNTVIEDSISYLSSLEDENGASMITHRRKTFVVGMITNAKSTRNLADDVLNQAVNPFDYVLGYKSSQDHIELLNSCIRGKNGNNKNPDVQQFRSALKRILLHASVTASRYANCVAMDVDDSPPIFSLKWTKNRTASSEPNAQESPEPNEFLDLDISSTLISENKENVMAYIGGCIVRTLLKKIDCDVCSEQLITSERNKKYLSFIALKDNGGLVYPAEDIVKIGMVCERYFNSAVSGVSGLSINASKKLRSKLSVAIITELSTTRPDQILFKSLLHHDIENHIIGEDLHSTQIMKAVVSAYMNIRLLRYGEEYTKTVIQRAKIGKRQQLNKLLMFEGL